MLRRTDTSRPTTTQGSVFLCVVTDQLNLFPSCTFATDFNDLSYLRSVSNNSTIAVYMSALTANRANSRIKCTMLLRDIYSCCHVQCLCLLFGPKDCLELRCIT